LNEAMSRWFVLALGLAGCTTSPKPSVRAPRAEADVAPAARSEASPNVLRDRRATSRSAPKPLALPARGTKCGKLALGTDDLDLLAGRFRVRGPRGAKLPPPRDDAPSVEEESRIVVEDPDLSMAIVARETFQLDPDLYAADGEGNAPGALDAEAPKFLAATFPLEEKADVAPVAIGAVRAYAMRPRAPNAPPGKDTALVLAMLVAEDDGALTSLAFHVRGERVRTATGEDLVGCTRLAERIAGTLVPGGRKLERAPGRRALAELPTGGALSVVVPRDYVAVRGRRTARLVKLRPLSQFSGSIVVSVTTTAAPARAEADHTWPGTLFGRTMEWRGKATPRGGFLFAAAPIEGGAFAEVLVKATRHEKALEEMRSVAETMVVVR